MDGPAPTALETAWAQRDRDRGATRALISAVLAERSAEPRIVALAKVVGSYLDYREHRYAQAACAGLEALAALEANPADPWLPRLYNTLAIIHLDLGERDTSRSYLDQQIRLSHRLGDRTYEAIGYHDLGLLQAAVEPQRGLDTLARARAMFQANADREHEALTLYNMANICQHAGERGRAADYANRSRQLLQASDAAGLGMYLRVHLNTHLAEAAAAQGRFDTAQSLLREAHGLAAQHVPELLAHVAYCRGLHLIATGDDAGALAQLQALLAEIGPASAHELLVDCYATLADCAERLGDYRAALGYHRAYAAIRERTFTEASEQKVRALDVIHRVEAERQRNAELQHSIRELEGLRDSLRALSLRDPLTGLHNRRYLAEEGGRLLRQARRDGTGLCAAMIDVDRFKQINDELGHAVGDLVLQQLAALLAAAVRDTDLLARYGGEEIALLLPSARLDEAFGACERLRTTIERYDWARLHPQLRVTISVGLADAGENLAELLACADAHLYAAKRAGRNRTSCGCAATGRPAGGAVANS